MKAALHFSPLGSHTKEEIPAQEEGLTKFKGKGSGMESPLKPGFNGDCLTQIFPFQKYAQSSKAPVSCRQGCDRLGENTNQNTAGASLGTAWSWSQVSSKGQSPDWDTCLRRGVAEPTKAAPGPAPAPPSGLSPYPHFLGALVLQTWKLRPRKWPYTHTRGLLHWTTRL